ncbi:putative thiol protease ulp-4 [Aphelenchoides bicaudatus]|nr:putative thiol protease ulp-4 [Aphelenchoides bicaudatus]
MLWSRFRSMCGQPMDCESSGYSSCSSSTLLLGSRKWPPYNKMQDTPSADCTSMPQTSAFKYHNLRYNRQWKNGSAMERIERQQLLSRKRKRTRQLHFDSARSTTEACTEESTSSSETTYDGDEFTIVPSNTVVMEEQREFTDDDLIMSEEQVASTQIESNAYRIDLNLYSPESLIDDIESELSESEISFLESDSDNEHEEDGYLSSEFFEHDDSDSDLEESEDSLSKVANILTNGREIVRHRFPFMSMRVFLDDFMCLMDDGFVNDTIMDFCLNDLIFNRVPEDLYKAHALPSTFWYIMQVHLLEDASHKNDSLPEKLMRRYSKLAGFMEQTDLFDQDFLVLPINAENHWSLCVVCCPNRLLGAQSKAVEQSNVIDPQASILMFDLQPGNRQTLEKYGQQMREFLQCAYLYQNGFTDDLAERFSDKNCPIVVPLKLPKQANPYDCGVYALEFANCFFKNPPNMRKVSEGKFEFLVEYPAFSISNKRCHLREEILSLSNDRHHFEQILGYR